MVIKMAKTISSETYQWGHIGLIIGKSIFYSFILYFAYQIYRKGNNKNAKWILILTSILLVVTLLGLVPILQEDVYTIE
jgi:hypothetical protein